MIIFRNLWLAVFLLLTSCGTPVSHGTASGKAETIFAGASVDAVKAGIVNMMTNNGYRITRDSQFEVAFDRPTDNVAVSILLGSQYDARPNARVSFLIASIPPDVRVVADLAVITNPGSAMEQRTEMNNGPDSVNLQSALDQLKVSMERPPAADAKPAKGKKS